MRRYDWLGRLARRTPGNGVAPSRGVALAGPSLFAGLGPFPFALAAATGLAAELVVGGAPLKDVTAPPIGASCKPVRIERFVEVIVLMSSHG